ncbi:MAG: hypothetical protein ACTHW7_08950 [Actinomycetaceae bacterium]
MIASTKSLDDVVEQFRPGDETRVWSNGSTLLSGALSNTNPEQRYAIAHWALDRGADPSVPTTGGSSVLELVLAARRRDLEQDVVLARRLIEGGADGGFVGKGGATAAHYLARLNTFSEEELAPLEDVVLGAPGVVVDRPNAAGITPAELAENFGRSGFAARLREATT